MEAIDYRNATWDHIKSHLQHDRETVYRALLAKGVCSTRELAEHMEWNILSVRPRVTDLATVGFVIVVKDEVEREFARRRGVSSREGLYKALSEAGAWQLYMDRVREANKEVQPELT